MIALVRDVSERKRAEEELLKANKRMRAELEAAAEIQRSLLPSHAQVLEKVRVAWEVQPCEELDGDTLNIFQLDREHLGSTSSTSADTGPRPQCFPWPSIGS